MVRCFRDIYVVMVCMCLLCGISVAQKSSDAIYRKAGIASKPLLIKVFEDVVLSAKKHDWKAIEKAVDTVKSKVVSLDKAFGTGIMIELEKAIKARDAAKTLNSLSNSIYLAMLDDLKLAAADKFKFPDKSLDRVEEARQYYEQVLSANIIRKDIALDKSITSAFENAVKGVENADEAGYDKAVYDIEASILKVYVKFQQKRSGDVLREQKYC